MELFDLVWQYILVFIFAALPFFEAYGVIPLAILVGLSPVPTFILGLVGNIATVLLVILFVNKIKEWRRSKKKEQNKTGKRTERAEKLWKKYGLPGLAMIGPLLVGSHLTAFLSVTFGGKKQKTFYWMSASIVIWSVVFTILIYFGIDLLGHSDQNLFDR